jgi:hypothetical protein
MPDPDYRACCDQLIQAAETLRDCWIERTGLTVEDDPWVEDAMSAVASVRAELYARPQGVTKAELRQVFDDQSGYIDDEQVMWWPDFHKAAREVLKRWGNDHV